MADDAERRQDHDVDRGMPEEPEQVLEQDRVAAAFRLEEGRAEVAVGQQHRDRAAEHRQGKQNHESRYQQAPHEQRHLVQRHAGRAHVEDGGDEVDRSEEHTSELKSLMSISYAACCLNKKKSTIVTT